MHKLSLDDYFDDDYQLMAVHAALPDFRLAFLLNKHLGLRLHKRPTDLDIVRGKEEASFPIFEYETEYEAYFLVGNRYVCIEPAEVGGGSLFNNARQTTVYLLPEAKKADYFIKVEDSSSPNLGGDLVRQLNVVPGIQTAYSIPSYQIKSKSHLNFDTCIPKERQK